MKFPIRCQELAPRFPDTRNLTPETYKLRYCFPTGTVLSECGLEKKHRVLVAELIQNLHL
jgi:hypothetical protein